MSDVSNIISNSTIYSYCRHITSFIGGSKELKANGILEAGEAEIGAPYEMRRAANTESLHTTVWFVLEGNIIFEQPGKKLQAGPGMAVVHSSAVNRICRVETGVFRQLFFYLPNRNIETTVFPASYHHELQELLLMLQRETYDPEPLSERRNILAALISSYLEKELQCSPEPHRLRKMIALIESRLEKNWTTASLATQLHISPSLLYQLCVRYYGESPGGIIRKTKFRHAAALLRQSDEPLDAIAEKIGYGNAFAFSKAFYKYTGTRPGHLRSQLL